tara:strand:+ start:2292 stop:3227 length:936 start_codon:yes stop_codon:yes gene_type:complete
MNIDKLDDPKNSLNLFGLDNFFDFLVNLLNTEKLPKVLLLSGNKGIGKFTLINHFLTYMYDKENYDYDKKLINENSTFYKQYSKNLFQNITYLSGSKFNSIKIDEIRDLKSSIQKTSIKNKKRVIILDDVELFNINSLNALLKIIEEPSSNNYFILINNKTRPLIDTIFSRCLEIKIILSNQIRKEIINSLIRSNFLETKVNFDSYYLTPGNFLIFNKISSEYNIDLGDDFLKNLSLLLNLYRKNKDRKFINMILFITNVHFYDLQKDHLDNLDTIIENKLFVLKNIDMFIKNNLNQNSLYNAISNRLINE